MNHLTIKRIQSCMTIGLLLFFFVSFAFAAPSPEEILRRAYQTENDVRLVGMLETTDLSSSSSAKVKVFQKGNRLRMEYQLQGGDSFVILDDGKTVYRLDAATKTAYVRLVEKGRKQLELLLKNYKPELLKVEKILGRAVYLLSIQPRYPGNPSKKIWVDQQTAVILRSEQYRSDGKLSTSSFYTQVDFGADVKDNLFKLPTGWRVVKTPMKTEAPMNRGEIRQAVGFEVIEPRSLPEGYLLDGFYLSYCPMGKPIAQLRYFDGLNSISLFEHPAHCMGMGESMMERMMRKMHLPAPRRARQAGGEKKGCGMPQENLQIAKSLVKNGLMFIFVGDLSEKQLQQMASSLE